MVAKAKAVPLAGNKLSNVDGWTSILTGLGRANRDKRVSVSYERKPPLDEQTLENLFHGDDLIARICQKPAQDMTREGIEIAGDADAKVSTKLAELDALGKFAEAITWARLFGGSLIIMNVNDGRAADQPLDPERANEIDDLLVVDRFDVTIAKLYGDRTQPMYGEPELFEIRTDTVVGNQATASIGAQRVHESRCLVFRGTTTSKRRMRENQGWPLGVVDRCHDIVRDFSAAYAGASLLLQDFSQATYKIKGLAAMLAADQDGQVLKRLQILEIARGIARAVVLDADGEEFERKATPTTGLPELLDRMASRLSAATDMPITILMGESPGGMNATGDSDHRNWYNQIKAEQETHMRKPLARLLRVVGKVVAFTPPEGDEIAFTFRSLWQPSEKETAETRYIVAQTDALYHGMGALDTAEISTSRWGGDKYSIETTIDTETRAPLEPEVPAEPALDANGEPLPVVDAPTTDPNAAPATTTDVQATALNGSQSATLLAFMDAVRDGLEPKAAILATLLCFPTFDKKQVEDMFNAISEKPPEPAPVIAPGGFGAKPMPAAVPPKAPPVDEPKA